MKALTIPFALLLLPGLAAGQVDMKAVTQSYDPASPPVSTGTRSAADVEVVNSTIAGGGGIEWTPADLGLLPGANVDAFSDGSDCFPSPGPALVPPVNCRELVIEYSVKKGSVGSTFSPSPVVNPECTGNGCASDVFRSRYTASPIPTFEHVSDALGAAVTPVPNETDLDALSWLEREIYPVFFSLDPPSAAAHGVSPADVLRVNSPGGPWTVYFTEAQLGLVAGDDVDALAVEGGATNCQDFSPTGRVVFSLSASSPSAPLFGVTEAGLFETFGAFPRAWAFPIVDLDTDGSTDDLNGVRISDPDIEDWMEGSQSSGGMPYDTIFLDGTAGNVPRRVRVTLGSPVTMSFAPLVPTATTIVFGYLGIPCISDGTTVPGLPGTLTFDPFGAGAFMVGTFPFAIASLPPVVVPLEIDITFQGVAFSIFPTFSFERTNAITLQVRC